IHGWGYFTHAAAIVIGCLAGHRICIRGESPWNQEQGKSRVLRFAKTVVLRHFLFRFVHRFLYIGEQNRQFYRHYGVAVDKMRFMPYSVDNDRFQQAALQLRHSPSVVRMRWGIPEHARVVLFVAKYIPKKRPLDLLQAIALVQDPNLYTIMVGEGPMRTALEDFIREKGLRGVILTGFVNQTELAAYYAAADIFVLCSGVGETWGLSVNEAMNFDLPVVISSTAGCSADLVRMGENGYVFREGDVLDLSECIRRSFTCDGTKSRKLVDQYSFNHIMEVINKELSL
ncbi:MAG TPA: glycosyltransferase family 4 protein, partial [Bacteroidia bacterium]|nr:glycosyltransferase family 4 protein [Bacteroidia bacterium]